MCHTGTPHTSVHTCASLPSNILGREGVCSGLSDGKYFKRRFPVKTHIPQHITKPLLTTKPAPASNQHLSYEWQCMESMLARYLGMHHLRGCCTVLYVGGERDAPPLLRLQAVRNRDTRLFYLFKNREWNPIHLCCEIKTLTHSTLSFVCLVMNL